MNDLAAFTLRPSCAKCGTERFAWRWLLPSPPDVFTAATGPYGTMPFLDPREHLRLNCENCGWILNMEVKDAHD